MKKAIIIILLICSGCEERTDVVQENKELEKKATVNNSQNPKHIVEPKPIKKAIFGVY